MNKHRQLHDKVFALKDLITKTTTQLKQLHNVDQVVCKYILTKDNYGTDEISINAPANNVKAELARRVVKYTEELRVTQKLWNNAVDE